VVEAEADALVLLGLLLPPPIKSIEVRVRTERVPAPAPVLVTVPLPPGTTEGPEVWMVEPEEVPVEVVALVVPEAVPEPVVSALVDAGAVVEEPWLVDPVTEAEVSDELPVAEGEEPVASFWQTASAAVWAWLSSSALHALVRHSAAAARSLACVEDWQAQAVSGSAQPTMGMAVVRQPIAHCGWPVKS